MRGYDSEQEVTEFGKESEENSFSMHKLFEKMLYPHWAKYDSESDGEAAKIAATKLLLPSLSKESSRASCSILFTLPSPKKKARQSDVLLQPETESLPNKKMETIQQKMKMKRENLPFTKTP